MFYGFLAVCILSLKLIYNTNNLRTTTVGMGCIQNGTDYH